MSDVAVVAEQGSTGSADATLARTIAAGDREAFVALMRRSNRRLYRTARSIVPDDLRAESALESAWLLAYRSMGDFRGETKLSIWLMRIVIGEALASLRKAHAQASSPVGTSLAPSGVTLASAGLHPT